MEQKLGRFGRFNDFATGAVAALAPCFVFQTEFYEKICLSFAGGMYTLSYPFYQEGRDFSNRIWQAALASHIAALPIIFCKLTPEEAIWLVIGYSVLKCVSIYFRNLNLCRLSEDVLFFSGSIALTKMLVESGGDECSQIDQFEFLTTRIWEGQIRIGDARGNLTGF